MKKVVLYIIAIAVIGMAGLFPFNGTDVSKLRPIETLIVNRENGTLCISTDDGLLGVGDSCSQALTDLKRTASGEVFLETADYLLLSPECVDELNSLVAYLRPACQVYLFEGEGTMENISKYLESHPSKVTLLAYMQGVQSIPRLMLHGEVRRLVE